MIKFIKNINRLLPNTLEDYNFLESIEEGELVEVKKITKKRTLQQNRALHLFFKMLSDNFNDLGMTFVYRGLKGIELETPYTETLIKETLWKPIQKALFDIESTTELTTEMINKILETLNKFFGEKGIQVNFPSQFDLLVKQLEKEI